MQGMMSFIFVLGFLVFVHEAGHFMVAKWVGVRVLTFSIGFGPRLIGFHHGGTDYRISAIPLGGYVKMAGDNPEEEITGEPDEFASKSVPARMAIILAGPFMNLVWAVIFFASIFYFWTSVPAYLSKKAEIGWVEPGSSADSLGLRKDDTLVSIGGRAVKSWQDLEYVAATADGGELEIQVARSNERVAFHVNMPEEIEKKSAVLRGVYPKLEAVIDSVVTGSPAERAGIMAGDRITRMYTDSIHTWYQVVDIIRDKNETPIPLNLMRDGQVLSLSVTPEAQDSTNIPRVGIIVRQEMIEFGLAESLSRSVSTNIKMAGFLGNYIGKIFKGKDSGDQIGGPIAIYQATKQAADRGLKDTIRLMAILSFQLGLLNLLPIPILDGGHMVLLTIEGVSGKPVSMKVRGIAQVMGLFILLSIMAFAFFNDITRAFSG